MHQASVYAHPLMMPLFFESRMIENLSEEKMAEKIIVVKKEEFFVV